MILYAFLASLLLPAPDPVPVPLPRTCEQVVCSHMPDCAPVITGRINFTSYTQCMNEFHCPKYERACLEFIDNMACLPEDFVWEDIEAYMPTMIEFREHCLWYW